ncbi:hypothetical protein D9M69_545940 [compost metagenome]
MQALLASREDGCVRLLHAMALRQAPHFADYLALHDARAANAHRFAVHCVRNVQSRFNLRHLSFALDFTQCDHGTNERD